MSQRRLPEHPGCGEGAKFPMSFFAASQLASGLTFGRRPESAGYAMGDFSTSNTLDSSMHGLRCAIAQSNQPKRAGPGDSFNGEENAGGREPPGRNTSRRT